MAVPVWRSPDVRGYVAPVGLALRGAGVTVDWTLRPLRRRHER